MMQSPSSQIQADFSSLTIDQLIGTARTGVSDAFNEIVHRYQARVYRTALKIVFHAEDAQDISQEVFVRVFGHLGQYREDAAFSTWITRIAINTSLMHLRKKRRSKCISLEEVEATHVPLLDGFTSRDMSPEQSLLLRESDRILYTKICRLPQTLRGVTLDRICADSPILEIAQRRKISVSATKSRLLRARIALSKELHAR